MIASLMGSHDLRQERVSYHALGQSESGEPELDFPLNAMETASTDEMRRRVSASSANGMFRIPPSQRTQMQHALDIRNGEVEMYPQLTESDKVLDAAYKIGVMTEKTNRYAWHNNRYWRCVCGIMAVSVFFLVALIIYWIVNVSKSVSDTLDKIHYRNPTIIQDTVDDARTLLHGAAVASHNMGEIAHQSSPSLRHEKLEPDHPARKGVRIFSKRHGPPLSRTAHSHARTHTHTRAHNMPRWRRM